MQQKDGLIYNSGFENDPRQLINKKMQPVIDKIYRGLFTDDVIIERIEHSADYILDRHFAIDTILTLPTGNILTGQEKCLTTNFMTLTIEYYQNPSTREFGDWFNIAAQYYFCGYVTPDYKKFRKWVIVDWLKVVLKTYKGDIKWYSNENQNGRARASFKYIKFKDIPLDCIITGVR